MFVRLTYGGLTFMKHILYLAITLFIFSSCKTSKNYLERSDNDNTLFDAVKSLKKRSSDTAAISALPVLYNLAQQRHLRKINIYTDSREISRWDKIINEYTTLQEMYDAINEVDAAIAVVKPVNYQSTIYDLKQQAAEDYYTQASLFLDKPGREDAKTAYSYFKKIDKWVPAYKDAKEKMNQAYQNAIVNVEINPVQDNSFFFNTSWGNNGYNFSNEYFQQTLVRDLGGKNSSRYPARFYTDWEARRDNVEPDWTVDLVLKNIQIYQNSPYSYNRTATKQIETGKDSSGRILYETVRANVYITRKTFSGYAEMAVNITDVFTKKNISYNTYREDFNKQEEYASYNGDSRALSGNDWALINNNSFNDLSKEEILNELYKRIYPQVRNRITYAVDW